MKINLRLFYDNFHRKSRLQKRIINDKNFTYRDLIKVLKKYIYKGCSILDVGCGVGTIDFYLADKDCNVLGIDISRKAIEICKVNSKLLGLKNNVYFKRMDFLKEKPQKKFDLILLSEILEHLENDVTAIQIASGALKKRGIIIISVPSENAFLYKIGFAKRFDREVGHLRRYSKDKLRLLVRNQGFKIKEIIKTEGVLRNILFLSKLGGFLIKPLNKIDLLSDFIAFIDKLTIPIFGESNIFIVAQKL